MLDPSNVNSLTILPRPVSASVTQIPIPVDAQMLFDVAAGDHYYMTIRMDGNIERVKVTGRMGSLLTVVRGQDGTTARNWNQGACLRIEWSPLMLCEFVQNCMAGAPAPSGVTAGTYCLSSCTCLDVGSDGRITKIERGTGC